MMPLAAAAREPIIALTNVSKDYESGAGVVHALRDVSMTIARGEFVAIVGTSGSGKSTLMNILGCLDRPTLGTYTLASLEVGGRTNDGRALVRNRLIGFIFQGFNLLPRTTALENCELPLQYRGVSRAERRKRAMASLSAVGLADRVHHTPNQLSGGQQQRVAIARALVTDPALLLADEPTGNLDTRTSLEVLALLQRLNRDVGITICLVTHEQDIAACASRVVTVRDGKIVSDVSQDAPLDAAHELAQLPPPQTYEVKPDANKPLDPREAAKRKLGGEVPLAAYFAMLGGLVLGALVGILYDTFILAEKTLWIPLACGALAEAWAGAKVGASKQARALTMDQRARLAIGYTFGTAVIVSPIVALAIGKLPASVLERIEQLNSAQTALALLLAFMTLSAIALLRYLLLSLLGAKAKA